MNLRTMTFLAGLLAASSCAAQSSAQYVYVAEQATATIDAFSVNASTGVLTPVPGTPFNERLTPVALATNPQGTFLFVANSTPPSVSVFAIQSNGALAEIANSPFSQDSVNTPAAVGVSPDGTLLYVAGGETTVNTSLGFLDVYAIASSGALTPATQTGGPTFQINSGPLVGLYVHPNGRWMYVAGGIVGETAITQFDVSATAITVVNPIGCGSLVRGLIGTSSFLYCANGQNEGLIATEAVDQVDGTLTQASSYGGIQTTGEFPASETLDSTGSFLYAAWTQNSSFSVANGVLTLLGTTAITNLSPLFASTTAPVLFAGNPSSPALSSFVIAADGSLTAATGSPFTLAGIATAITTTGVMQVASAPGAGFSPTSLSLPGVTTGQTSTGMASLVSTGTATLDIGSISLSGSSYITQMNECPATLAPQASCTINFTFAPLAAGPFMATLQVTGNASATLNVVGTAAAPVPQAEVAPNFLGFPNTAQGSTSSAMTFMVTDTGTAQLNVTSVALGGANPGDFKISSNNCGNLAVNGFCTVGVEFFPQATGMRNATILVTDNASDSPQTVMLSGTGETAVPPQSFTLTVSAAGPGGVTQSPVGTSFPSGTVVQLTAVPGANATFTSWSGGCQGTTTTCSLTMNANESPTATFASGTANQSNITVTPTSQTVAPGVGVTYGLALGLAGSPTFTITGCPTNATCSVASNGNSETLTVVAGGSLPQVKLSWLLLLLVSPFLMMPRCKRFALASAAALVICAACGGSGNGTQPGNPPTPAGQYTVVVTASSQGNSAIGQATVVVD